jgi:DNA-binding ferritin-like protein (Dps family)
MNDNFKDFIPPDLDVEIPVFTPHDEIISKLREECTEVKDRIDELQSELKDKYDNLRGYISLIIFAQTVSFCFLFGKVIDLLKPS